jgi:Condensation domain
LSSSSSAHEGNISSLSGAKRRLLDKYLKGEIRGTSSVTPAVSHRPLGTPPPLSPVQEQVWRNAQAHTRAPSFYNESITIHRTGDLDVATLEEAFTEIIRRHEAWRTTFETIVGKPVQIIHPPPSKVTFPIVDLSGSAKKWRESEMLRLATNDARLPFDLRTGPLVRPLLVTLDKNHHRLFLTMHQSIVDGVSVYRIFPSELTALYEAFSRRRPSPLPGLPLQYSDLAFWERQAAEGTTATDQISYWRQRLCDDVPQLAWPSRRSSLPLETPAGAIRAFTLPADLCERLKALSHREGVSLFMSLLAGLAALLSRYSGQNDVVLGTVAPAGRKRPEAQQLLGYFLNPVALRMDLSANLLVRELLRQTREVVIGALAHDDVPFESLLEALRLRSSPVFRIVITLAPPVPELDPGWQQTPMDVDSGWAKWDLYLELSERPAGMIGRAQYRTDVFRRADISRLLQDYAAVLQALASNSQQRVSDLPRRAYLDHYPAERGSYSRHPG